MAICYLVGAGDFVGEISKNPNDIIIAADGGYDALIQHGYIPDLLIGDFDSIECDIPENIETLRFPKEKDETDMLLAYREGVKRGYKSFVILGATGGRLDHTMANIALLAHFKKYGHEAKIIGQNQIILAIKNESTIISGTKGEYFSIFAYGSDAMGVSVKGAKYSVSDTVLSCDFPLGVSNEFLDTECEISVMDGTLIIMYQTN